jgi:hypothetical protein
VNDRWHQIPGHGLSCAKTGLTLNGLPGRVRLNGWLYTSPGPVLDAAIISVSSSGNRKAKARCNLYAAVALSVDTKLTGASFQVMAQMAIDKIPSGPKLDALTAEKSFGWRNVHQHDDRDGFYGKRQDKAGFTSWRRKSAARIFSIIIR